MIHLEGASTHIADLKKRRPDYWYNSRRRFFVKAYGVVGLMIADILWSLGRVTLWLRTLCRLGGDLSRDPQKFTRDLLWGDLTSILTGQVFQIQDNHQSK